MASQIEVGLRPWSADDFALLTRLMGDPAMMQYLGGPETPEKIRERHERYLKLAAEQKPVFAVIDKANSLAVGWVGYWASEWQNQPVWEMGWSVLPEFQGQGIASNATKLAVERAAKENKYQYLYAFPTVDNLASNAVCRKVGFTLRGEFEGEYPPGNFEISNAWYIDLSKPLPFQKSELDG